MTRLCDQILSNEYLIQILQADSETGKADIYNCLKKLFHEVWVSRLIKKGRGFPSPDRQRLIAEEAFQGAFMALLENARKDRFKAKREDGKTAGSTGYFFVILLRKFQAGLKSDDNKDFSVYDEQTHGKPVHMSADLPTYNQEDGMFIMMRTAISMLSGKCREYLQWQYIEKKETGEIISMVQDGPGTVRKDLSICRQVLKEKIKELYNIGP